MNAKILIAGVAVAVMITGAADAKTLHHRHHSRSSHAMRSEGGSYAAPSQPIPYAELGTYMKDSPRKRSAMMSGGAQTGGSADTSATTQGSSMGATGGDSTGAMSNGQMNNGQMNNGMSNGSGGTTMAPTTPEAGSANPGTPAEGTPNMSGPNNPSSPSDATNPK